MPKSTNSTEKKRISAPKRPFSPKKRTLPPPTAPRSGAGQLILSGLRCETTLGVRPEERAAKRLVVIDLAVTLDLSAATRSDDLADTVDWAALCGKLRSRARRSRFRLAEALAGALLATVLAFDPRITAAEIKVHKPGALPGGADAAVRLSTADV